MNGEGVGSPSLRRIGPLLLGTAWVALFLSFGGVSGIARGAAYAILSLSLIAHATFIGVHPLTTRAALSFVPLALPAVIALLVRFEFDASSEATFGWLMDLFAVGCVFILSAESTRTSASLRGLSKAVLTLALVVATVPLAHMLLDERALFGVFPGARPTGPGPLPLINPNHTAALSNLMLAPSLVLARWPVSQTTSERVAAACCALSLSLLTLATQSTAGIAILGAIWLAIGVRETSWHIRATLALLIVPIAGSLSFALPALGHYAWGARLTMWRTAVAMWLDNPWLGVGPGNFGTAVSPYRTDADFADWVHAHNEWVQWLSETGIIGVLCLAAAGASLLPGMLDSSAFSRRARHLRWAVLIGLGSLAAHSIVDFPLRIPATMWVAVALLGALVHLGSRKDPRQARPSRHRSFAITIAVCTLTATPVLIRTGLADLAEQQLRDHTDTRSLQEAVARLEGVAPWRPTLGQGRIILSQRQAGQDRAFDTATEQVERWPDSAAVLRAAATVAVAHGELNDAEAWVDRALQRAQYDWRLWVLKARISHANTDIEGTLQCWAKAFESDAPITLIEEAISAVPLPVLWLDALTNVRRVSTLIHFARWFQREGADQEAALTWDLIQWREPDYAKGRVEYLFALIRAGRAEDAAQRSQEAIRAGALSSTDVRGVSFRLQPSRTDLALKVVLAASATDAAVRGEAVQLLNQVEGADAALQQASQWLLQSGADANLHRSIASVHRSRGNVEGCIRSLATSRSLVPAAVSAPTVNQVCSVRTPSPIDQ